MGNKKIKTILFDLGGVIITLAQEQAVERFRQLGLQDAEQRLDAYTQSGIFGDLERGIITAEDFRRELSLLSGRELTADDCLYAWLGYRKELPQRNLDAMTKLRQMGYRIVLVSNTNPYMMSWARSNDFDGNGHSLDHYVDALYMSYKIGAMKPDEAFFSHVIEAEGTDPAEGLFVDDGPRNVEMARKMGFQTLCPANGEDWTGELFKLLEK